jgi:hypothetical protein
MNRLDAGGKHRGNTADSSGILLFSAENGLTLCYNFSLFQQVTDEFRYSRNRGIFRANRGIFWPSRGISRRNSGI